MKCINMMNIHGEKRSLKEFMEDLDNENTKSIRKRDINYRDLLANYKKLPLLLDDKIFSRKSSLISDDELHIVNLYNVSSNTNQHREFSFVHSQKNRKKGIVFV